MPTTQPVASTTAIACFPFRHVLCFLLLTSPLFLFLACEPESSTAPLSGYTLSCWVVNTCYPSNPFCVDSVALDRTLAYTAATDSASFASLELSPAAYLSILAFVDSLRLDTLMVQQCSIPQASPSRQLADSVPPDCTIFRFVALNITRDHGVSTYTDTATPPCLAFQSALHALRSHIAAVQFL